MSFQSQIDALLTAHSSDSADELERKLSVYDVNDIVAVVAKRAATGGGGGGGSSVFLSSEIGLGLDNAAQTIADSAGPTAILYDTIENEDGSGDFTADTVAGTITVLNEGLYLIQYQIDWADNADGVRLTALTLDPVSTVWNNVAGNAQNGAAIPITPTASQFKQQLNPTVVPLAAGTVVGVTVQQTSGVPLDVTYAQLTIARLL